MWHHTWRPWLQQRPFALFLAWLRPRRPKRHCCLLLPLAFLVGIALAVFAYHFYFQCSGADADQVVKLICQLYHRKRAYGNMCHDLCHTRQFGYEGCKLHHLGKEVAFTARWKDARVVVKATYLLAEKYDQVYWTNARGEPEFPSLDSFLDMMHHSIERNLDLALGPHHVAGLGMLDRLWVVNSTFFTHLTGWERRAAMNNIWHLLQQTEYLLGKYFEVAEVFPRVVGACGHLYAVKYVEPVQNFLSVFANNWNQSFEARAEHALKILELLLRLDVAFPQRLHLCDVKIGHFGVDDDGKMKILDADMALFESAVIDNLIHSKSCAHRADCSFIDCMGTCDSVSSSCGPPLVNDNLQRVCRNVFLGRVFGNYFGLLGYPPPHVQQQLQDALDECRNGNAGNRSSLFHHMQEILRKAAMVS